MSGPTYTVALTSDERTALLTAMQRKAEDWDWHLANRTARPTADEGGRLHAYRSRIAYIAALQPDKPTS